MCFAMFKNIINIVPTESSTIQIYDTNLLDEKKLVIRSNKNTCERVYV